MAARRSTHGLLAQANESRLLQAKLQEYAQADLRKLFSLIEGFDPDSARNFLLENLPLLASGYGEIAAAVGAEWFEYLRLSQVGSRGNGILADPVPEAQVIGSVRFSAAHLFAGEAAQAEAYLSGQLAKWVAQPMRETITHSIDHDPIGYGWQRVVRPGGCDFCKMLADRGGVYTRKSVWFASHANCNCGAVPSWDRSLPEVNVKTYEASKRMESVRRRADGRANDEDIRRARANAGGKLKTDVTSRDRVADQRRAQQILDDHRKSTREWIKSF